VGAQSLPKLLTVDEFLALDTPPGRCFELHEGELVELTVPNIIHRDLQIRLLDLLREALPNASVLTEYSFKTPESVRSADVGVTNRERHATARTEGILSGAPDLVVEVLSPSSKVPVLKKLRRVCFQQGCKEFWVVDPDERTVEVYGEGGKFPRELKCGEELAFSLFGEQAVIAVEKIFDGIVPPAQL